MFGFEIRDIKIKVSPRLTFIFIFDEFQDIIAYLCDV